MLYYSVTANVCNHLSYRKSIQLLKCSELYNMDFHCIAHAWNRFYFHINCIHNFGKNLMELEFSQSQISLLTIKKYQFLDWSLTGIQIACWLNRGLLILWEKHIIWKSSKWLLFPTVVKRFATKDWLSRIYL